MKQAHFFSTMCFSAGLLATSLAMANPSVYSNIPLIGTETVPANDSNGYGALTAVYDEDTKTLYYEFSWHLAAGSDATAVHFHGPAEIGETAGVEVNLGAISGSSGSKSGMTMLTTEQEADLLAGLWYLNLHTNNVPSGELRGQLVVKDPLDSVAVYDANSKKLHLNTVMVPTLGVFDATLRESNAETLTFELESANVKNEN